ncbi:MAG: OB-fold nucleic acid binding domain-containing protein [Vicinamibacterales bacterium]
MVATSCRPRSPRRPVTRFAVACVTAFGLAAAACGTSADGTGTAASAGQAQPASGAAPAQAAAPQDAGAPTFTGAVTESINSGGYTYARLQADGKDVWIAATEFPVTKGERLTVLLEMPMQNFHSNTLDRDFPLVYFVSQVARDGQSLVAPTAGPAPMPAAGDAASSMALGSSHATASGAASAPPAGTAMSAGAAGPPVVQPNPPPAGGLSIADAWAKRQSLSGKPVTVRGTVVKVNNGILGRNWFHLRDGSGNDADATNDLTVTTDETARPVRVGEVVTVTGTLGIDKDFGAGYAYSAILEQAIIK